MNTFFPTVSQPNDPTAAGPSASIPGTRVSFIPATGSGGIYDADQDALTVHGAPACRGRAHDHKPTNFCTVPGF
jgi:hypothetical protein